MSERSQVAPHPPLAGHYRTAAERQPTVNRLFDATALHYDRINSLMSLGAGGPYRRSALRRNGIRPGMRVIDVGCGTGVLALHAARIVGAGGSVLGVDPSQAMRREAARRSVHVAEGTATSIPVPDASADFVTMGYALRHVGSLAEAFSEFDRVLRPGGRVLILEITAPRSQLRYRAVRLYLRTIVPRLSRLATGSRDAALLMDYFWESIDRCVPPEQVTGSLADAGFEAPHHRTIGILSEYTATKPVSPKEVLVDGAGIQLSAEEIEGRLE